MPVPIRTLYMEKVQNRRHLYGPYYRPRGPLFAVAAAVNCADKGRYNSLMSHGQLRHLSLRQSAAWRAAFALKQTVRAGLENLSRKLAAKGHLNRRAPYTWHKPSSRLSSLGVGFFLMASLKGVSGSATFLKVQINGGAYYAHILPSFLAPLENARLSIPAPRHVSAGEAYFSTSSDTTWVNFAHALVVS
jgi:hypothetical protein